MFHEGIEPTIAPLCCVYVIDKSCVRWSHHVVKGGWGEGHTGLRKSTNYTSTHSQFINECQIYSLLCCLESFFLCKYARTDTNS